MRKLRKMPSFSEVHSVTLNDEAKLSLSAASAKWPELADGFVQSLISEVIRDWEQWANVERSKHCLLFHELQRTSHLVRKFSDFVKPHSEPTVMPYDKWCEVYAEGNENYGVMPSKSPISPNDIKSYYTIWLNADMIRALKFAFSCPGCAEWSVSGLIKWVIIDWAKWDTAYVGKAMLQAYELYKIQCYVAHMARDIPFSTKQTLDDFNEFAWQGEYWDNHLTGENQDEYNTR